MQLDEIGMVAADTSRTQAYLQSMIRHQILPAYVLVLESASKIPLPGQLTTSIDLNEESSTDTEHSEVWSEARFDPKQQLIPLLEEYKIPYELAPNKDINDDSVVDIIRERPETVFIYSGFGGVLLRKNLLSAGKKFLHVHGGCLPAYKGSTTNYYSLLAENSMGASSIFLSEEIDSGPILLKRSFPSPPDMTKIDHIYDSAVRAKVLVETLKKYKTSGRWEFELSNNAGGETFFIIHPVLKHIAMLQKGV